MNRPVFLIGLLMLAGCDQLTGAADQKIVDAEAVGFACRVAQKQPEVCMKENEAFSPSSILDGWKSADEEIKEGKLDPGMSNIASPKPEGEEAAATEGEKPAEGPAADNTQEKPADPAKDEKSAKPAETTEEKPAEAKDKAKH